jgi:hypothetical protein
VIPAEASGESSQAAGIQVVNLVVAPALAGATGGGAFLKLQQILFERKGEDVMKTKIFIAFVLAGCFMGSWLLPSISRAEPPVVQWENIIGIIQAGNLVGSGAGQVTGGAQPWSTKEGFAKVNLNTGKVRFLVEGLVFAGGNSIGTPGPVVQVRGTLVCDTDGSAGDGDSVLVNTPLVDLDEQGGAKFVGVLGPLPEVCQAEPDLAFLIRTGGGNWIANGAVRKP